MLFQVSVLERWKRTGTVEASSPDEAMKLGESNEGVKWDVPEYLEDIKESVCVTDERGIEHSY